MNTTNPLPKLVTFDGEARSGKGTVVQATKDYLRDHAGLKTMLIDAGQVFRVLVVGAMRAGVDVDDPGAIDTFLADEGNIQSSVELVKRVYHMSKDERDALLYTNQVGANSAKIGGRPASQNFKDNLLRKWLQDAREEGFEAVLLDGRALEEIGSMLEEEGLCDFVMGLYFVCDPVVGARRTLGFADCSYDELTNEDRQSVDVLVEQIIERNAKDTNRQVHPIFRPKGAPVWHLPLDAPSPTTNRPMFTVDTSAEMNKKAMVLPVARAVAARLAV